MTEKLTEEETERFRDLVQQVTPIASILTAAISEDDAALLEKGVAQVDQEESRTNALYPVLVGLGVDPETNENIVAGRAVAPVVRQLLSLRATVLEGQRKIAEGEERRHKRDAMRSMLVL